MAANGSTIFAVLARLALISFLTFLFLAFAAEEGQSQRLPMELASTAFKNGEVIPQKYTCEGADVSPALSWAEAPQGTKTLVLIVDDPDAPVGTWVHWVLFNLPATARALTEAVPKTATAVGGLQGRNDFQQIGYGGPCPPRGKPHRYFFKLYALDAVLDLRPGATKRDVEAAMKGHIQANGELMGTYQRSK